MVNWKDQASKDRLLAAVIADITSKGVKVSRLPPSNFITRDF